MARWQVAQSDPELQDRLVGPLGISPITAQVLINRGIVDPDLADRFLHPTLHQLHDPFLLPDMEQAVTRLMTAIAQREAIVICGDYDTDGVCGAALLWRFFRMVGAQVGVDIPHRSDGYGLQVETVRRLHAGGAQLLVTIDNGSTARDALAEAARLGVPVLVTDHHEPGASLPPAVAVINPKRAESRYPFRGLCGTGVAFKLIMALRQRLRACGWFESCTEPNLRPLLDLVAVATVADVVPLIDENRLLVAVGMRQLAQSAWAGLRALMEVAQIDPTRLSTYTLGFQIGPRLNAAGRMAHAQTAAELLMTDDAATAVRLAQEVHTLNTERQATEQAIRTAVDVRLQQRGDVSVRSSIVMADPAWPSGVIGIVAGRIAEQYRLPTILIGIEGEWGRGSARSVGNFPLLEAIAACAQHLERYGGHRAAAGVTVRAEWVDAFAGRFEEEATMRLTAADREKQLSVDALVVPESLSLALAQELAQLGPFGLGNPEPLLLLQQQVVIRRRIVGRNHLQLHLQGNPQPLQAIAFSHGEHPAAAAECLDLVFTPTPNTWNGSVQLQLQVRDLRAAERREKIDTVR
ncbi:MAG: single-stranded-DNA-specific exonuclease RecJ [Deltaproteobacteria bacterium]|nr:single-stranded-DNA-specific exonuclease RecJ [Deltaproteobacteria bacterium]